MYIVSAGRFTSCLKASRLFDQEYGPSTKMGSQVLSSRVAVGTSDLRYSKQCVQYVVGTRRHLSRCDENSQEYASTILGFSKGGRVHLIFLAYHPATRLFIPPIGWPGRTDKGSQTLPVLGSCVVDALKAKVRVQKRDRRSPKINLKMLYRIL